MQQNEDNFVITPSLDTPIPKENGGSYEYNTLLGVGWFSDLGDVVDCPFSNEDIKRYLIEPMKYNKELRCLGWWAYRSNGDVASSVDYMRSMHTLDGVPICRSRDKDGNLPDNFQKNCHLFTRVLEEIHYKQFFRDALLRDANDGIVFYYFETSPPIKSKKKFLSDFEVMSITEINNQELNVTIHSLPVDYCKIVGRIHNTNVVAFNLKYFLDCPSDEERKRRITTSPKEIRDAWFKYQSNLDISSWVILDYNKTIACKIKSSNQDPWGIPLVACALDDILYADYFMNTKRATLDDVNNQIIYEEFPEGKERGRCALSQQQQQEQHDIIKSAILNKSNRMGRSFFSVAAGTKLNKIDVNLDIFDEKNQSYINEAVASALGISSSSLNGNSKGNYATASLNIELVAGNVYSWICDIVAELNKCINQNVIKDPSCIIDYYIFPTTYVNRDKVFNYMKTLYTECGGSLQAVIAASGMNVDGYLSLLDYEQEHSFDEKYPPHQSMYTQSGRSEPGRPEVSDPTNTNTVMSKSENGNQNPKPSTQ